MLDKTRVSAPLSRYAMAYVLAGGRGSRLLELTDHRAKPAVYFGGKSRIIDFALSNALNSGIRRIGVATQYKAHSLIRHLQRGWNFFRPERNESFDILPASQQVSENSWYAGTADAVTQNIEIIRGYGPRYMVILAGDHIYKQDYELMLQQHVDSGADVTVGCLEVPPHGGGRLRCDGGRRARQHHLVPREARRPAGHARQARHGARLDGHLRLRIRVPVRAAASRRRRSELVARLRQGHRSLHRQARQGGSASVQPLVRTLVGRGPMRIGATPARSIRTGRPTSTSPTSYRASTSTTATGRSGPTARSRRRPSSSTTRTGGAANATNALVSGGCIISGTELTRSLLFTGVHVHSYGRIHGAVILPYAKVGRGARLRRVIIDRGVRIPEGLVVGEDPGARRRPLPADRQGHLPHHPAYDRPAVELRSLIRAGCRSHRHCLGENAIAENARVRRARPRDRRANGVSSEGYSIAASS